MILNRVFEPIQLAGLTLPNRILMGSMHVGIEGLENGMERLATFYAERAKGEAGLIVTGGIAVCPEGGIGDEYLNIFHDDHIEKAKLVADAVHREGGRIAMQLFHTGRYAYKEKTGLDPVAPSPLRAPINSTTPRELTSREVEETIQYFVDAALRAQKAGYDAVEIMGSEGYLINQFLSPVTNKRTDEWGGDFERRSRFGVEIAKRVKEAVGKEYPVIFRMSGLDLIPESTTMEETQAFAKMLQQAGVDALNIGIGWHESQVPTIYMTVPRGSFVWVAQQIKAVVSIPVVVSNRINDVRLAEEILRTHSVDMVSMARPFLADPYIVKKSEAGKFDDVNTCIACNQACLDHVFSGLPASCLVNPVAGRELELPLAPADVKKTVAVVGAGPAGLEAARVLAERGHQVVLFDKSPEIGGQLLYAKQVPGKTEFNETLRYYRVQLHKLGVDIRLGQEVAAEELLAEGFEEVVLSTGVSPRQLDLPGADLPHVVSYTDVFEGKAKVGRRVVIIGAGGIACDLSHLLLNSGGIREEATQYLVGYRILDPKNVHRYSLSGRKITMLRRGKHVGTGLGKTTRWATIATLKHHGVEMITQIDYKEITPEGVTIIRNGEEEFISADTVIIAAGANSNTQLSEELQDKVRYHIIGGAKTAGELDAKRAIYEGTIIGRQI
ncbi:FAD-dependent oxidoreductase [Brevibacillus sp. SYSU BS000544]|uniref:oxidoreductase n=1 Tax=Brevibacillus sp. SYSU BS000544 TaxID=3416443 RepID=UPI003CE512E6